MGGGERGGSCYEVEGVGGVGDLGGGDNAGFC